MRTLPRHLALLYLLAPLIAVGGDRTEALLLAQANALVNAQVAFDQPALEKLLAPGYMEVSPVGDVDAREEVIGFYSAEAKARSATGPVPESARLDDVRVSMHDDAATLIAREIIRMQVGDDRREIAMRVQFQFRRVNGQWLLASTQYTGIRAPGPKPE